nr:MAG TPA: hypothetical protein [Caudoviricetes sp.]
MTHCADEDELVLFDAENSAAKDLIYGYFNRDTLTSSENHIKKMSIRKPFDFGSGNFRKAPLPSL